MFLTNDQFRHPLSHFLGQPDTQIWQAVEVELHSPWFLVELKFSPPLVEFESVRTLLLSRVRDVVDAAQLASDAGGRLLGVAMISAGNARRSGGWAMHPLAAIWAAHESGDPKVEAWVFKRSDGSLHADSVWGSAPEQLSGWRLVVECPHAASH